MLHDFINAINTLLANDALETVIKLVLIVVLAGIVGYERESYKKPAGFRTNVLVGISGVLVMMCGIEMNELTGNDATRIPAQFLSGIGFIGAGTILRDGFNVKGLTTAAALLAIACVGMLVGGGFFSEAIIATVIVYVVLSYAHKFYSKLEHYEIMRIEIATSRPKYILEEVKNVMEEESIEMEKIKIVNNKEDQDDYIKVDIKVNEQKKLNNVITKLMNLETVSEVEKIEEIEE